MDRSAVMAAVGRAFEATSRGLSPWPSPRPDGRPPAEDEYSRLLDPDKYRLLGARFEAWARVLEEAGWCRRERDAVIEWVDPPGVTVTRTERLAPHHPGALDLVVVHSRIDTCSEAGLVLGIGVPATEVADFPGCGCDACDDGSEPLLEDLDETLWGLVSGAFVEVRDGERWARSFGDRGATCGLDACDYEAWMAEPGDRLVTRGAAWDAP